MGDHILSFYKKNYQKNKKYLKVNWGGAIVGRYVLQRFVYMFITLFLICTVTFFLMKLLPGSPLHNQEKLTPEQQHIIKEIWFG